MSMQVGKPAPDFEMDTVVGTEYKKASLSDYKGKWLIFYFYPEDFTFVCPTEIKGFSQRYKDFKEAGAEILGGSTDSKHSHRAWIKTELGELNHPLFADVTKEVSRDYGVLKEDEGIALRGLFIINPKGILEYQVVHDLNVGRSVDETLRVLKALQTGAKCPIDWNPGEDTL